MPQATLPAFLEERRNAAAELAATLSLPAKKDEAWRRTSLEGLDVNNYKPVRVNAALSVAGPSGAPLHGESAAGALPEGVIFTDILTAAAQHPDLVEPYLGGLQPAGENLLTALQAAHLSGGIFLYVPKNVSITAPLMVEYTGAEGQALYLHTLVVAEANSQVSLLERYEGSGDYLHVGVTEVYPLDGARVQVGYLQNQSEDAWSFSFRKSTIGRNGSLDWAGGEFGGALVRSELKNEVAGEGGESTIKVVYGASGTQHIDIVAAEVHTGNNGRSDILGRGVLSGRAHTVFRGNGTIRHGAQNSTTYQRQQALVLSAKARADAIPALIIDETEVSGAGHAATVGKLDDEQLFYLMARGLSRQQAITMLVMAFLSPVLDQIPSDELRGEMTALMAEKVMG